MKRQHYGIKNIGPVPIPDHVPFKEDLIFYAPLNQNDLRDYVTGITGVLKTGSTMTWDSSKCMYYITTTGLGGDDSISGVVGGLYFKNITAHAVSNITMYVYAEKVEASRGNGYNNVLMYGNDTNSRPRTFIAEARITGDAGGSSSTTHSSVFSGACALAQNTTNNYFYLNGTQTYTSGYSPISGNCNSVNLASNPGDCSYCAYYIKDVRIYGRYMSAAEVAQLSIPVSTPSAPTNVTADLNGSISSVLVSWNSSIGATSYKVYRSSSSSGTYTLLSTVNATSYTDNSPLTGMNYYKIIASNSIGDSDYSSAASVDTSIVPATPTGLTATPVWNSGLGAVVVDLSWNASTYATGYKYYRSTSISGPYTLIDTTANIQVTDTPSAGITYYYKVRAINSNGESSLSSHVSVDTSGTLPPVPTNLVSSIEGSKIELTWNASSGATSYEVYRSTAASGNYTLVTTVTTNSALITPLSGDNYFKVKAVNSFGSSDFSNYTYQNYTPTDTWLDTITNMGCVFYAPMDSTYGLTDRISGIVGEVPSGNNSCTITWDNTLNAYVINNTKSNYIGIWWNGLNLFPGHTTNDYWTSINKTWICTHRFITRPASNYYNPTFGFGGADGGLINNIGGATTSRQVGEYCSPYVYPSDHTSINTGSWYMMAGTNESTGNPKRTIKYYRNGTLVSTTNNDSWALKYQARLSERFFGAGIMPNNGSRTHVALKNIYVFNRCLTQAEIQTIYNHDGL